MIKVTSEADKVCVAKVIEADQGHVFNGWDELSLDQQRCLIDQLQRVDFQLVHRLVRQLQHNGATAGSGEPEDGADTEKRMLKPPPAASIAVAVTAASDDETVESHTAFGNHTVAECREAGEEALREGKLGLVTLSGGVGLGPDCGPTGMLPLGPVSGKSLFQLHAEKVRAINRRYRVSLPWYIVEHPDRLETVREFFRKDNHFGLSVADLTLLAQPLLPYVDRRGKFLLSEPGRLALCPNGHGGILVELLKDDVLERITSSGIEHFFFFQIDNPLVQVADPVFLGHHILNNAEVTSKSVTKTSPDEKLGVFCRSNGSTGVVEYSELCDKQKGLTQDDGTPGLVNGNIAMHLFSVAFLRRLEKESIHLPFHLTKRHVPCIDRKSRKVEPKKPNGTAFSCYLFDALWNAKRAQIVEVRREDEFAPIKATSGANSPETARHALSDLYTRWLRDCGAHFNGGSLPSSPESSAHAVEISPLYALDLAELREKIELPLEISGDTLLGT